jgi:hypothetical protein
VGAQTVLATPIVQNDRIEGKRGGRQKRHDQRPPRAGIPSALPSMQGAPRLDPDLTKGERSRSRRMVH